MEAAQVVAEEAHLRRPAVADQAVEVHLLHRAVVVSLQVNKQLAVVDHPRRQAVVVSLQASKQLVVGNKDQAKTQERQAVGGQVATKPLETQTTLVSLAQKAEVLVVTKEARIRAVLEGEIKAGRKKTIKAVLVIRRNPISLKKIKVAKTRRKRVAERKLLVQLVRLQEPISEARSAVRLGNVSENLYTEFLLYSYSLLSV